MLYATVGLVGMVMVGMVWTTMDDNVSQPVRRCAVAFASIFTFFIVGFFGICTLARQEWIQKCISNRDVYLNRGHEAAKVRLSLENKFTHSGLI